jgi:hypothetical protein
MRGSPTLHPSFDLFEWNALAGLLELAQAAPILFDIRPFNISYRVKQGDRFGQQGGYTLAALLCQSLEASVSVGVDIECATHDIHSTNLVAREDSVERHTPHTNTDSDRS